MFTLSKEILNGFFAAHLLFYSSLRSDVISAGETDTIIMTIKIGNKGETAFHNYLYLEYPGKDPLNLIHIDDVKIVTDSVS